MIVKTLMLAQVGNTTLRVEGAAAAMLPSATMTKVRHESVFFTGHVQGVGFRYTTMQIAREFEVTGFVKNLVDGRVQLEIEGKLADVEAFVAAVEERMHGYIRKTERSGQMRAPEFAGFAIR